MFFRIVIIAFIIPITSFAAIYSWTDEHNTTHFSDEPQANAAIIDNKVENPARTLSVFTSQIKNQINPQNIAIISPKNAETIYYDNGKVPVKIETSLQPNEKIVLLLDGKAIITSTKLIFNLQNIERGEHTLQAQVFTKDQLIGASDIITFFMHQTTIEKNFKF